MVKKFKKKPITIEAVEWTGKNFDEISQFIGENYGSKLNYENAEEAALKSEEYYIRTLEGVMIASKGDWILKGIKNEFYPIKPDILVETYEEVE